MNTSASQTAQTVEDALAFERAISRSSCDKRGARAFLAALRELADSPEQLWRIASAALEQRKTAEAAVRRHHESSRRYHAGKARRTR